ATATAPMGRPAAALAAETAAAAAPLAESAFAEPALAVPAAASFAAGSTEAAPALPRRPGAEPSGGGRLLLASLPAFPAALRILGEAPFSVAFLILRRVGEFLPAVSADDCL